MPTPARPILDRMAERSPGPDRQGPERYSDGDRRDHISAAAARAFVRHGFHAATMQQVAEEAGMSAGNLYRYFPSKEALVEGICTLDARERAAVFGMLAGRDDLFNAMAELLREHLLGKPRDKAIMILEIAAEAGRNPRIAAMTQTMDAEIFSGLVELVEAAKASGQAAAWLDPQFAANVMFTFVGGLFRRKALDPDFDTDSAVAMSAGLFKALFAGAISPEPHPEKP